MSPTSDAFILVTIPNATLTSSSTGTLTGQLVLEYVTFDVPTSAQVAQDVLLVLVLRSSGNNTVLFEAPLDPARALSVSSVPSPPSSFGVGVVARQRYVFHATQDDAEFTVELPENGNNATDDIELFRSVLVGYVTDVRVNGEVQQSALPPPAPVAGAGAGAGTIVGADEDLRGRFVLMNEDDGEIVGTLDRSVSVVEDPSLEESGREKDTLVVEVPEGADIHDGLLEEEVLVSTIPPEERDWMLKTAVFVSHAISGTTTLLTSAMAGASNLYIANSTPSTTTPNSTATASPRPITPNSSSSASKSRSQANSPPPPPAHPSRTLLLLQSPTTRKNLTQIHAVSGSAAKLSSKAAATVDSLIQRATGSGNSSSSSSSNPNPNPNSSSSSSADKGKGRSPTPQPQQQQQQGPTAAAAAAPLRKRTSVALSAALILASIEASAIRLVDAGSAAVTAAVTHKYGATAGENAALAGRTARNIVLVYVDVRGLGRRVIVKRMTKSWVKGRIASVKQGAAAHKR